MDIIHEDVQDWTLIHMVAQSPTSPVYLTLELLKPQVCI